MGLGRVVQPPRPCSGRHARAQPRRPPGDGPSSRPPSPRKLDRNPCGTAAIRRLLRSRVSRSPPSDFPRSVTNTIGLSPPPNLRAASRIYNARPHSGTRCSHAVFIRLAGTGHTPSSRSIALHAAPRHGQHQELERQRIYLGRIRRPHPLNGRRHLPVAPRRIAPVMLRADIRRCHARRSRNPAAGDQNCWVSASTRRTVETLSRYVNTQGMPYLPNRSIGIESGPRPVWSRRQRGLELVAGTRESSGCGAVAPGP